MVILQRLMGAIPKKQKQKLQDTFISTPQHDPRLLALFSLLAYWPLSQYQSQSVSSILAKEASRNKPCDGTAPFYNIYFQPLQLSNWKLSEYAEFPSATYYVFGYKKQFDIKTATAVFINDSAKEAVVAFRGTNSNRQLIINDIVRGILLSDSSPEQENAINFTESLFLPSNIKEPFTNPRKGKMEEIRQTAENRLCWAQTTLDPSYRLFLTGHSLGGHLAQIAAYTLLESSKIKTPNLCAIDVFNSLSYPTSRYYFKDRATAKSVKKHVKTLIDFKKKKIFLAHRMEKDLVSLTGKQSGEIIMYHNPEIVEKYRPHNPLKLLTYYHSMWHFLLVH